METLAAYEAMKPLDCRWFSGNSFGTLNELFAQMHKDCHTNPMLPTPTPTDIKPTPTPTPTPTLTPTDAPQPTPTPTQNCVGTEYQVVMHVLDSPLVHYCMEDSGFRFGTMWNYRKDDNFCKSSACMDLVAAFASKNLTDCRLSFNSGFVNVKQVIGKMQSDCQGIPPIDKPGRPMPVVKPTCGEIEMNRFRDLMHSPAARQCTMESQFQFDNYLKYVKSENFCASSFCMHIVAAIAKQKPLDCADGAVSSYVSLKDIIELMQNDCKDVTPNPVPNAKPRCPKEEMDRFERFNSPAAQKCRRDFNVFGDFREISNQLDVCSNTGCMEMVATMTAMKPLDCAMTENSIYLSLKDNLERIQTACKGITPIDRPHCPLAEVRRFQKAASSPLAQKCTEESWFNLQQLDTYFKNDGFCASVACMETLATFEAMKPLDCRYFWHTPYHTLNQLFTQIHKDCHSGPTPPTATPTVTPKPTNLTSPTPTPTSTATPQPTNATDTPTAQPTDKPTNRPTPSPTPTNGTDGPIVKPTIKPTQKPTDAPKPTNTTDVPTVKPTIKPTQKPTLTPPTQRPPTQSPPITKPQTPTQGPTQQPTTGPSTPKPQPPTQKPQPPTQRPTTSPINKPRPTNGTSNPSGKPTQKPTQRPTQRPSKLPTQVPTDKPLPPTQSTPTQLPTQRPTDKSQQPSQGPPSQAPSSPLLPTQKPLSPTPTPSQPTQRPPQGPTTKPQPPTQGPPSQEAPSSPSSSPQQPLPPHPAAPTQLPSNGPGSANPTSAPGLKPPVTSSTRPTQAPNNDPRPTTTNSVTTYQPATPGQNAPGFC